MILNVFIPNWFLRRQYQFVPKENMHIFSMNAKRETYPHTLVGRIVCFQGLTIMIGDNTRLVFESLILPFPSYLRGRYLLTLCLRCLILKLRIKVFPS